MDDCLLCIFSYLPLTDIYNCIPVCKQYNKIVNSELEWKSLLTNRFVVPVSNNYKSNYQDFHIMDKFMGCGGTNINISYSKKSFGYFEVAEIPPMAIKSLTYLQQLHIHSCDLLQIPSGICSLTNLQTLSLISDRLTSLPEEICQLIQLTSLYLHHNYLKSLPPTIGQLTNLQTLFLHGNNLEQLPDSISQLTNLQRLTLSKFCLLPIPDNIKHAIEYG